MYCIYLRKSRKDIEAERLIGEGETLARHKRILLALAKSKNLDIGEIYQEVVSGETIAARAEMQRLLADIEKGMWDGVLVMEIERLARGSTIDQGIIAQVFRITNTKIITPAKDYDPKNEFDEEHFEFSLFMSRREYKTICRRLQSGREASTKEGFFIGSLTPFGYEKQKQGKGFVLVPHETEAPILKKIFEWYTVGELQEDGSYLRLGVSRIATKLNRMAVPTKKGGVWVSATLRDFIKNPVYIGKTKWKGSFYDGQHEPLISVETFELAQEIIKMHHVPAPDRTKITNPLAGLMVCGKCGRKMVRRKYTPRDRPPSLICSCAACDNVSSYFHVVEERLIEAIRQYYKSIVLNPNVNLPSLDAEKQTIARYAKKVEDIERRRSKLYDLLERGVYKEEVFFERQARLSEESDGVNREYEEACLSLRQKEEFISTIEQYLPRVFTILENYEQYTTAEKNDALKSILEKVVYTKEVSCRHVSPDQFTLDLYPKLPCSIRTTSRD